MGLRTELSLSKNAELHLDVVPPSGSDLFSLIPVTLSSESHDPDTIPSGEGGAGVQRIICQQMFK